MLWNDRCQSRRKRKYGFCIIIFCVVFGGREVVLDQVWCRSENACNPYATSMIVCVLQWTRLYATNNNTNNSKTVLKHGDRTWCFNKYINVGLIVWQYLNVKQFELVNNQWNIRKALVSISSRNWNFVTN